MTSDLCIAVHALVFLDYKACPLSSEVLAENICTNAARVRKVLAKLHVAGWVETKEGADGGYLFVGNPEQITLADIAQELGTRFVEMNWISGNIDKDCAVSSGMAGLMNDILDDLDDVCKKRLRATTVADVSKKLLHGNGIK
jgi:DNA-binding IscR family transcriptional regulator